MTCTNPPDHIFPIGTTDVKYTAKDISGNSSPVELFKVLVQDKIPPKIEKMLTIRFDKACKMFH